MLVESKEKSAVKAVLQQQLSVNDGDVSSKLEALGSYLSFPIIEVEEEEQKYETRFITFDNTFKPGRMKSRKVGNFRFNLKKFLDELDIVGVALETALDGVTGYLIAYKIVRFGLAGSTVDFDEIETLVFYSLYERCSLPSETGAAYRVTSNYIEQRRGSPLSKAQFHETLDTLARFQVIRIEADQIHQNELVLKR
ncbi:hypothetical protein [uncultured Roseobacter sp.]|uniref:hypothetical protein n=1 Tax=uncultured Roseobacter sp. TaxID=114847 RepID=UPI002635AA1F|nr:hypothetical protein [uncultured Roseobacter sp.]